MHDLCLKCNHRESEHPVLVLMNVVNDEPLYAIQYEDDGLVSKQDADALVFADFIFCTNFQSRGV